MNTKAFKGTGVAIVTPFRVDGSIDFNSLKKMIEYLITREIDYLVVLGTTGESATLNHDEKEAVVNYVAECVDKRKPIVRGIGGNNTREIISCIQDTDLEPVDGILSVTPYYNKPSQKGLYNHYKQIACACPLPLILYNVPGRTGTNINAETTLNLAHDLKNIVAIKEASGNLEQIGEIIKNKPDNFLVLSGDDSLALPSIALGADGIISVTANAFPLEFSQMISAALNGNFSEARKYHYLLNEIMQTLFSDGNPAGIKAVLSIMGIVENNVRLPLTPVKTSTMNKLKTLINELQVAVA